MSIARKLGLSAVAGALGLSLVGISVPAAQADSSWGCPGCKSGTVHPVNH